MNKVRIFSDGAARGNPGPSGVGVVIEVGASKKNYREFIGYAKSKNLNVECFLDSELIVKQLNHEYKVLEENIQKFFLLLWNLSTDFKEVKYFHIPRAKNSEADRLANMALDEATRAQSRMF